MRTPLSITILLFGSALAACTSTNGGDDAGSVSSAAHGSVGVVQIERVASSDPDLAEPGGVVSALFARYRGVEGQAVIDLFGLGASAPLETCEIGANDAFALAEPGAVVELLDAGELEVRVAGTRTSLTPRMFPELGGVVSGAFYAEDAALGVARADVDEYVVSSRGAALPGFDAVAVPPAAPVDVWVAGIDATTSLALSRTSTIDLAWAAGDPRDHIDIELSALGETLRCSARDDGAFSIDADLVAALPSDRAARLVVRRVRITPFDAPDVETAWIFVSTSRAFRAELR